MTQKQGNKRRDSLPTGREGRKALTTGRYADLRREEDIITSLEAANDAEVDRGDIMDKAVIAMVNLYLKNIPLSERCSILESVVHPSTENTEIKSGIRAHIDGAKLADLIDMAKAYLAELLNVKNAAHPAPREEQPEEPFGSVFGVDMINTPEYDYYSSDGAEPTELVDGVDTESAADGVDTEPTEARVVRVDDIDEDGPKYNPALEMSFNNLINKSWMVLFDLMKNLSGSEYVTHMPYEMAEMIVKNYYKLM